MADTKISALTAATVVNDTDEVPLNQGGTSKKASIGRLNRKITNLSTSNQTPTASTLTLLSGSTLAIPTGVTIGTNTLFQWKIVGSKTAVGTAATVFNVRLGTAGTTADTAVLTFTLPVGTAAIDNARFDIMVNVRTTGATGVLQGSLQLTKTAAATAGWINVPTHVLSVTSGSVDLTVANLVASVSVTTGATIVSTFTQVVAEAVNV